MTPPSGMEELRALMRIASHTQAWALAELSLEQVVKLLRACLELDLETLPDQLTPEGRAYAAEHGKVSTNELRRLYQLEGLPETGLDWEGR